MAGGHVPVVLGYYAELGELLEKLVGPSSGGMAIFGESTLREVETNVFTVPERHLINKTKSFWA